MWLESELSNGHITCMSILYITCRASEWMCALLIGIMELEHRCKLSDGKRFEREALGEALRHDSMH